MSEIVENNPNNNIIISKDIEHLVFECQNLLLEFFKKNARNFDSSKLERMKKIFLSFSVIFVSPDEVQTRPRLRSARCNLETKTIEINNEVKLYGGEKSRGIIKEYKIMSHIIHEYGHAFSDESNPFAKIMEEGIQISLQEKVMDYYFRTRGINASYKNIGYDSSFKSLAKTLLYVLSKTNQDIDALSEYLFGDKKKFLRMLFSEEFIKSIAIDDLLWIRLTKRVIYDQFPNEFLDVDESSIYCDDNDIVYSLWLQNYVKEDILGDDDFKWITSKKEILEKYRKKYGKKLS